MAIKKPEAEEEIGCPLWMVSFGDAMSLLVTFFVMLLAFSTFEEAQLASLMGALKGGLNVLPSVTDEEQDGRKGRDGRSEARSKGYEEDVSAEDLSKVSPYDKLMRKEHSENTITDNTEDEFFMRMLEEGLSVVIKTDSMFAPGTTVFLPHRTRLLGVVVDMGLELDNELRITSVLPEGVEVLDDRVRTPWGLAARRAVVVQKRIMDMSPRFPLSRFSLGTRIEPVGHKAPGSEGLPPERMELTYVGYRDIPVVMDAESSLIRGFLD